MWKIESRYIQLKKRSNALLFAKLVGIMEDIKLEEGEQIYMKIVVNPLFADYDYYFYGIISENPVTECTRRSKLHRKYIDLHFSDKYTDLVRPKNIDGAINMISPYVDTRNKKSDHVLGIIIYETPQVISLVCKPGKEEILKMCV